MFQNEKWYIKSWKGDAGTLAARLGVSRRLAELLVGRGLCDAAAARGFLKPDVSGMYDALLMKDMDVALGVLERAAADGKKVLVIGDYDVDGIMGLYILCAVFRKVFGRVSHYIPHRVDDGYGINEKIVEEARHGGVGLIVTCDNGISAHESVLAAKAYGIEVVITDHHEVPSEHLGADSEGYGIPGADAVVDPKRQDCGYPFKGLCGAAVAYKLATAFAARMGIELTDAEHKELFCFMAIATVCDIVELVDENRRIVYHGLRLLNEGIPNRGLAELMSVCGLAGRELTTYGIGHVLGPCINAAGRLDTAELSYRLFVCGGANVEVGGANEEAGDGNGADGGKGAVGGISVGECAGNADRPEDIAAKMLELNRARQEITSSAISGAMLEIGRSGRHADDIIVLYMPDTHESVSGIVAGKLKDRYGRPVIVLTDSRSGHVKGSGRSVEGYDLLSGVASAREFLLKYGGHSMAVGVTMDRDNIDRFRDGLLKGSGITPDALVPKERIDICLRGCDVVPGLVSDVARLEPFGRGNPRPVFALKGLLMEQASLIGARRNVIKMKLRTGGGSGGDRYLDAVYFGDIEIFLRVLDLGVDDAGCVQTAATPPCRLSAAAPLAVDLLFHPEINEYNGSRKLQLTVRSVRRSIT